MRLFVAIDVGPDVVAAARSLTTKLRDRARQLSPRARITWADAERVHLTVRFIGEVDEQRGDRIQRALVPPIAQSIFTVEVGGLGAFPPGGPLRVIWVGIKSGASSLAAVEQEVSSRLERAGVSPDRQPYSPHLTLGRVRDAQGLRASALLENPAGPDGTHSLRQTVLGLVEVRMVTLYASYLRREGPEHRALLKTPLATRLASS
jgi:2'-5' RNA ligase